MVGRGRGEYGQVLNRDEASDVGIGGENEELIDAKQDCERAEAPIDVFPFQLPAVVVSWIGTIKTVLACLVYLTVGPTLILTNRHILKELHFDFPMALSGLGLLFTSAASAALVWGGSVRLEHSHLVDTTFVLTNLAPVGAAMASTLAFGNAVYLYLPVGYIQMLKAFTPSVTLLLLCLSRVEMPSTAVSLSVLGICVGTAMATMGAGSPSLLGIAIMLAAEVAEATRLVLQQKLLQNLKFGVIEGQYYMAPVSALWLFSAAALFEMPRAMRTRALETPFEHPASFLLSASLGLLVNLCASWVIKLTNSVTLKVLSTARNACLILVSAMVLGEEVSALELCGYSVSLVCFGLYNCFRIRKI